MKFSATLLVLATSALASNVRRGDEYESPDYSGGEYEAPEGDYGSGDYGSGDYGSDDYGDKHDNGYKHEVTQVEVTYTTTTVCPVTYTHHEKGYTYYETKLTTSTVTVVEAKTVDVTVKEPDVYKHYTDVEYVTRTSLCPVTVTKTIEGEVITEVYTTTSYIYDVVKTTDYEHVKQPDVTKHETDVVYKTRTTVCPVTVTKTIAGEVVTETYTTTSVIEEVVKSTDYEHVKQPDVTKHETDVVYTTRTTVCPVTLTKTIAGEVVTETYTTTSVIEEVVKSTDYEHVKQPDVTKHETDVVYTTRTTVCPVTLTKTIAGEVVTETYTTTSVIEEVVKSTDYEHVKQPDVTKYETDIVYKTKTHVYPVTVTKTIEGEVITNVYTSTDYEVVKVHSTVYDKVELPDVTKYETDIVYKTKTHVYPVTVTKTIEGEVITNVYTSTDYEVVKVHSTVYDKVELPDVTKHETDVVYHTKTSLCPVTVTKTVEGEVITNVYTSTSLIVEEVVTTIPVYETIVKTMGKGVVITQYSKIVQTVGGGTVYQTVAPEPTTVEIPETEVVTQPEVTVPATPTAQPEPIVNGAAVASNKAPVFAFMAGILGAVALL
ncbi:hypothetical protein EDB82DRAFT_476842 [Fusarium venenatum]|uniref:uncharacterized protein n=1 Tax=Fusarium venenatum TaxID=56646 RepID=UPI001DBE22AF|nr:hypothetical protein EDB82DRAFT_476842 [Fusarium venenatum]